MRIGIIGLSSSGKRTLFRHLTHRVIPENRKPGESLEGAARIFDPRVERLSEMCKPQRTVYAENHFVLCPDMAGSTGRWEWLEAARRCDLLCIVVRAFDDPTVYHPRGSVDAARDRLDLESELLLADMELVEKRLYKLSKEMKFGKRPEQIAEEKALNRCQEAFDLEKRVDSIDLDAEEKKILQNRGLVTAIPLIWAYNVNEDGANRDFGEQAFAVSAKVEEEISQMADPSERHEFLEAMVLRESGLERMNMAAYSALDLMSFYTIGPDEVRAWTIRKGASAPGAGGVIHSDIERGFIRVEVIKYDCLMAAGSEKAAKSAGQMQLKGRDYVMQDGDICHFLFNV